MIYFETERLILRGWRQEDLPRFVAMNKDERVMRYFPATLSDAETESFFLRIHDEFQRKGWGLYAVELKSTGQFIGYVGLHEDVYKRQGYPGRDMWLQCHTPRSVLSPTDFSAGFSTGCVSETVRGCRWS